MASEVLSEYHATIMSPVTFADKVISAIEKQGRKKNWIAKQLQMTRPTLDARLTENNFTVDEQNVLKDLLRI